MGIIALMALIGAYIAPVFITSSFLTRQLIAEEKFHLLTDNDQIRVVAGKRRKPLQVSEAEKHLEAIHAVVRKYRWVGALVVWRLYGPKQTRELDTDLDKVRKQAIESQRQNLLINAMEKGYDNDPVMSLLMKAETDESFKIIQKRIDAGEFGVPIAITADEAKVSKKSWTHRDSEPIVLMTVNKKAIAGNKAVVTANSAVESTQRRLVTQPGGGVRLPEGYSWDLTFSDKGYSSYEKMNVVLLKNGKRFKSEGFYTHIWGTPSEQKGKIREIQKSLATAAHHDLHEGGIDKSFLS